MYDPHAKHSGSLDYSHETGRDVFFRHNRMCREVDVLVAFVPEASMGTAIEMWEAYGHGAAVVTISPLRHNWAVKFLSHALYADLAGFEAALQSGGSGSANCRRGRDQETSMLLTSWVPPRMRIAACWANCLV